MKLILVLACFFITHHSLAEAYVAAVQKEITVKEGSKFNNEAHKVFLYLNKPAQRDISFRVNVSSNTAESKDYADVYPVKLNEVVIKEGHTIGYFDIYVTADNFDEGDEVLDIKYTHGADNTDHIEWANQETRFIIQNDDNLEVSAMDLEVHEHGKFAKLSFTKSTDTESDINIEIALDSDSRAKVGEDFLMPSKLNYVIPANSNSLVINFPIIDDNEKEKDESFLIKVKVSGDEVKESRQIYFITIIDNDKLKFSMFSYFKFNDENGVRSVLFSGETDKIKKVNKYLYKTDSDAVDFTIRSNLPIPGFNGDAKVSVEKLEFDKNFMIKDLQIKFSHFATNWAPIPVPTPIPGPHLFMQMFLSFHMPLGERVVQKEDYFLWSPDLNTVDMELLDDGYMLIMCRYNQVLLGQEEKSIYSIRLRVK